MFLSETIIGGILGLLGAIAPDILDMIRLAINKRQPKPEPTPAPVPVQLPPTQVTNTTNVNVKCEAIRLLEEQKASKPAPEAEPRIHDEDETISYPWLEATLEFMKQAVRPLLTYGFFLLFVVVKLWVMSHAFYVDHTPAIQVLPLVWDDGTEILFASAFSFWFGSKVLSRFRKKA